MKENAKVSWTCLKDSVDITKLESNSTSSGWTDAFCALKRLITCIWISTDDVLTGNH